VVNDSNIKNDMVKASITSEFASKSPSRNTKLIFSVTITMVVMLMGMFLYQGIKYLLFPELSLIQSNIITIIFSTTIATVASYFILRHRWQIEEALRKSETKYRIVAENTNAWEFWLSPEGKVLYSSPSCKRITGYDSEQFLADPGFLDRIIHPEDSSLFSEHRNETGAKGVSHEIELRITHADGTGRWISHVCQPVFDEGGHFLGRRGSNRDITLRKQAEEGLKQISEELKRSNIALQQFAFIASHDLQEPLRGIESFVKVLEKRYKGKFDEKADEYIHYIIEDVKRMQMLIKDLLEYSRISAKDKVFSPVNCSVALEQALHNLRSVIDESCAAVTYDFLPDVMGDEVQLIRVFQNLIGNAVKFRSPEPLRIHVSARREGDEWIFSVRDNGIGIDPTQAKRIFDIFQRLHTREEYEGTGIGLAICKRIVERHGGRIWVESEPGQGATFYFTISERRLSPADYS
jgi:PAS domain S-box-containing protein